MTSSSGHKLGQIVGNWFEEEVAVYLLARVAEELKLFLDHRFKSRTCRKDKIIWQDLDGNDVDYDFVLELGGTDHKKGIPLAFFETFWRRGARHSKDKARDDSGKLMPMRITYPTTRILGIIAAGDFTAPAQEFVRSRSIDLFYIPKNPICRAWENAGIQIDYEDNASEAEKNKIADQAVKMLNTSIKEKIFQNLVSIVGMPVFDSYVQRIIAGLAALPIEYSITTIFIGQPIIFSNHEDAEVYLKSTPEDDDKLKEKTRFFRYKTIFSDGSIFERNDLRSDEILALHNAVGKVTKHFTTH